MNKPSRRRPTSPSPIATEQLATVRGGFGSIILEYYQGALTQSAPNLRTDSRSEQRDTNSTLP